MLIVIGTGLAGYSLVREFRKLDRTTPVLMISTDDGAAYSKPMLSSSFTKRKTADDLVTANAGKMAEQLDMEIRTFTRVTRILPATRQVCIGDEMLSYTRLVLAIGAEVRHLPLSGDGADQVVSVNDLMDYRRLRARLLPGQTVAILGAGLIGCEFANDFLEHDLHVHVIAPAATVLPLLVPEQVGQALEKGLRNKGVNFHLGCTASQVDTTVTGSLALQLSDGSAVQADVVIAAVGLLPRIRLAGDAGLAVGKGIVVDDTCRTSDADIYALGDCAELRGQSLLYVQPLMVCARALAKTLTARPEAVRYPVMPVIVKTAACPVVVVPPQGDGCWEIDVQSELDVCALFRDQQGRLTGFALAGQCTGQKQALTLAVQASLADGA